MKYIALLNSKKIIRNFAFIAAAASALFFGLQSQAAAQGFGVSPGRIELEVKPGSERTTVLTVDYGKEPGMDDLPNIRIITRSEDWGLDQKGELITAAAGTLPRSATDWLIFSPAEFTIGPGTKQTLRLTVAVPPETPPGDYYTAVYIEDRDPPPPPTANNPQLNIRYRFYSLIYVMVPELTKRGEITNLAARSDEGRPVIEATLKNSGNSHLRGFHSVVVSDENGKTVAELARSEARVLLGEREMTLTLGIDKALPAGKYSVAYSIDFGKGHAVQVGRTKLEIPPTESAMVETPSSSLPLDIKEDQ